MKPFFDSDSEEAGDSPDPLPANLIRLTNAAFEDAMAIKDTCRALEELNSNYSAPFYIQPPDLFARLHILNQIKELDNTKPSAPLLMQAIQSEDLELAVAARKYIVVLQEKDAKNIYTAFAQDAHFKGVIDSRIQENMKRLEMKAIHSLTEAENLMADIMLSWRMEYIDKIPADWRGFFSISIQSTLPPFLYEQDADFFTKHQMRLGCVLGYFRTPPKESSLIFQLMRVIQQNHPKETVRNLRLWFGYTFDGFSAIYSNQMPDT
jgi:hypothetical protein